MSGFISRSFELPQMLRIQDAAVSKTKWEMSEQVITSELCERGSK